MFFFIPFPSLSNCSNLYHHKISTWTSYKWNHLICSFFFWYSVILSAKHFRNLAPNVDCIHNSFFFYYGVVFHCVNIPQFVYPFFCWWTFGLSPVIGQLLFDIWLLNSNSFWLYQLSIYSLIYYIYIHHYPLTNMSMQNMYLGWDYLLVNVDIAHNFNHFLITLIF